MNNVFLHILREFPAVIKFFENKNEIFSVSTTECLGDEINIEIESFSNLSIYVYPIENKELIPYSFNLVAHEGEIKCDNGFAMLFKLPEENYVLKLFPLSLKNEGLFGNKIELEAGKIKRMNYLQDLAGRAKVEIFCPTENSLSCEEEYYVYLNKETSPLQNDLIILDFFEAIRAKDFKYAIGLISQPLSDKLDRETITSFFGEFSFCKIVNYFSQPSVVLFYKNKAKVFGANITDNKISDVYEIN